MARTNGDGAGSGAALTGLSHAKRRPMPASTACEQRGQDAKSEANLSYPVLMGL